MALDSVVVVGGSLAGLRSVESLRRRGFSGRIAWVSGEAHRPYDRPPLSKQILRGEWDAARVALKSNHEALGVEWIAGVRATALDVRARRVTLSGGDTLPYDGLVIATGAAARRLPGAPDLEGVHTLRTIEDALAIRAALVRGPRVAVVGAGFIGLEVAAACRALGLGVTVVESLGVPLAGAIGGVLGERIAEMHRGQGVRLLTGVGVHRILGERSVEGLLLSDGSRVEAEVVIVGVGVTPETAWLEGSGVALEGGVLADGRSATNVPGVVTCGDVARFDNALFGERMRIEHWSNAVEMAASAAASLLEGSAAPLYAPVPYFWSDQYDAKIQFAGRVRPGDDLRIVSGSVEARRLVASYGRAGRLVGTLAVNEPASFLKLRRAIAAAAPFE